MAPLALIAEQGSWCAGPYNGAAPASLDYPDGIDFLAAASQRDLQDSRWRGLLEALPVPIYTTDASGLLTFFNAAAAEFWGRRPRLGEDRWCGAWKLFSLDGVLLAHEDCPMGVCLREARPVRGMEAIAERPDGERVFFQPHPTPLFDARGTLTGAINMLVDITAHKNAQARQEALFRELESAKQAVQVGLEAARAGSQAKSTFLANMSHELRTPLNGVIGAVSALTQTQLDARQLDMLDLVADSARNLERILSDILDVSKIEAGGLVIEPGEADLVAILNGACALARCAAEDKGLSIDLDIQPGAEGRFAGDPVRIRQVIANLLSNAVKFTQAGRIAVKLAVQPPRDLDGACGVSISVRDTGEGFDAAMSERLFERFEQADASVTRSHGGAGLGLPISRDLIRLMGGDISVQSKPGVGSCFTVDLPLERLTSSEREARERSAEPPAVQENDPAEPMKVLVVEDHAANRRVVQLLLEPFCSNIRFAENGLEAVEACRQESFDVVLMDMQMPVMDGLAAITEIRARERSQGAARTPIAVLSANVGADHETAGALAGADAHIAKPVTLEALIEGINLAMVRAEA